MARELSERTRATVTLAALSPTASGGTLRIAYSLSTSSGTVAAADTIVACRTSTSANCDFGHLTSVAGSGAQSFTANRNLACGTYNVWNEYYASGEWTDLTPKKTFRF